MPTDPPSDADLRDAVRRLAPLLEAGDEQLAVAESCTGGLIGHLISDVPQASDHFLGGIISYSSAVKERLLRVPHALIEDPGPVSEEVAAAMCDGAFERFPAASIALAVTCLAGPQGSGDGKPVGLTYVAMAHRDEAPHIRRYVLEHDRDGNKRAAALAALELVAQHAGGRG
jgi:PncC family amidohydrolase